MSEDCGMSCEKLKGFKVFFFIQRLDRGGAERQLIDLAKRMHARGVPIGIVVFNLGGALERELHETGVVLYELGKTSRWGILGPILRLIRLIGKEQPQILHSYLPVANIISAAVKPFLRRVKIVWGVRASNVNLGYYDWATRISYLIEPFFSRFADLIIINSRAGFKECQKKGFSMERSKVVHNGIDTDRYRPDSIAREKIRAIWGVKEGFRVIGFVGRLDPIKDHPTFFRSARILVERRSNLVFVCVGGGPDVYQKKLMAMTKNLNLNGHVVWQDFSDDMPSIYNAIDLLCSSSTGEGFSNVIGEAMACGIPCVVTDVGDSKCIVGEFGIASPSGNAEALAKGCERILDRLEKEGCEFSLKNRERIVQFFSLDRLVENTSHALQTLISGKV